MLVEQDVAEDDVGDAVRGERLERRRETPRRRSAHVQRPMTRAQAEPLGLRGEHLGPQAVRSAARRLLVEHRHHRDDVERSARARCSAAQLSLPPLQEIARGAATRDRLRHGHGSAAGP